MKGKRITALLLVLAMVIAMAGCGGNDKDSSKVVAKVGEVEITQGQWEGYTALACYSQGYDLSQIQETEESKVYLDYLRNSMLVSLVSAVMLQQDYESKGETVLPDTYETDVKEFVDSANKEISEFLKNNKLDNEDLRYFYTSQQYLVHLMNQVQDNIEEGDTRQYYTDHQDQFTASEDMVRASHILVADEDKAKEIIAKLDNGESFADLAAEFGTDGTKSTGGDLGPFVYGDMLEDFSKAAFALKKGEYTKEPVKSDAGYHVILCTEKLASGQVQPYEWVEDSIYNNMEANAYYGALAEIEENYPVEYFVEGMTDDGQNDANDGGEAGDDADADGADGADDADNGGEGDAE